MKNNNLENFIKDLRSIKMTYDEKNKIKKNLEIFVSANKKTVSPYQKYMFLVRSFVAVGVISIMTIPLSSYQLKKSVPGEIFYPMKIAQEKIELATITKTEKKVKLAIKRTDTRIKEAIQLHDEESLTQETQKEIIESIEKEVSLVQSSIDTLNENEPEKALPLNTELEISLEKNKENLEKVLQNDDKKIKPLELIQNIEKNIEKTKEKSEEIENKIDEKFSIENNTEKNIKESETSTTTKESPENEEIENNTAENEKQTIINEIDISIDENINPTNDEKELNENKEKDIISLQEDENKILINKEVDSISTILEMETKFINLIKEKESTDSLKILQEIQNYKKEKQFGKAIILLQKEITRLENLEKETKTETKENKESLNIETTE